ncbi:hypothetical protein ADL03_10485 [Nocardia sp. NRRL S-836]|nr:hypothetical protein ADL03_10485 [Nocardia sp. NRRL S-836]
MHGLDLEAGGAGQAGEPAADGGVADRGSTSTPITRPVVVTASAIAARSVPGPQPRSRTVRPGRSSSRPSSCRL